MHCAFDGPKQYILYARDEEALADRLPEEFVSSIRAYSNISAFITNLVK